MRSSSFKVVFLRGRLSVRLSSYDNLVWPGMVWAWFGMHIDLKYQVRYFPGWVVGGGGNQK